jgi:hypothetical protein
VNIVLINWSEGENDPFSLFNQCLAEHFLANGRHTITVQLDSDFAKNMRVALDMGVDFAMTWQGLGFNLKAHESAGTTIWDDLKVPLVCLHGDHPCHAISNHIGTSEFVYHLYAAGSFAKYANRHIPRTYPAQTVFIPNFFMNQVSIPPEYTGDYFVLPKNYDDTLLTLNSWRASYPDVISDLLVDITEAIKAEYTNGNSMDHHEIIDHHLTSFHYDVLKDHFKVDNDSILLHHIHATVDKFYRNFVSEYTLLQLKDVKVKIFGRGWDRFISMENQQHEFRPFNKAIDGNQQFHSNYGILDVAPINDSLHDRTMRAVANKGGFLLASSWNHEEHIGTGFSTLFHSGKKNELRENAERIMKNPAEHRALSTDFGQRYRHAFSFYRFLKELDALVGSARRLRH